MKQKCVPNLPPLFQVLFSSTTRSVLRASISVNTLVLMSILLDSATVTVFLCCSEAVDLGTNWSLVFNDGLWVLAADDGDLSTEHRWSRNFCRSTSITASFTSGYVRSMPTKHTYSTPANITVDDKLSVEVLAPKIWGCCLPP